MKKSLLPAIFLSATILLSGYWHYASAEGPFVTTNPPNFLGANLGRLNGFADPRGNTGQITRWFEWGETILLGNSTNPTIGYGNVASSFSESIFLTDVNQTYYFRAVAQNSDGITYGLILNFKSPKPTLSQFITRFAGGAETAPVANSAPSVPLLIMEKSVSNLSFENGTNSVVSAKAGDTLRFLLKIENRSTTTLKNLTISDTLSPFLEFAESSEDGNYNISRNEVSWNVEKMKPKEIKTFAIKVKAKKFSDNIVLENSALTTNGAFFINSNIITMLLNASPISLSIKPENEKVSPGEIVQYGVHYKNEGRTELKNVLLKIILPKGIEYKESAYRFLKKDNAVVFSIGDLAPKEEGFAEFKGITTNDEKEKQKFLTAAVISYEDAFTNQQEDIIAYAENTLIKKPVGAAAGIFAEEGFFAPSLLYLSIIASILIISAGLVWHFRRIYIEKNEEAEMLRQKIAAMNRMTIEKPTQKS